ncbi:MAG: hypothetical protein Q7S62_00990 [bacterium]|nr:hypothetical protein [bacterium]
MLFSVFPPATADALFWIPIIIGGVALTSLFDIPFLSDLVGEAQPLLQALLWFVNLFVGSIASLLGGIYFGMGNLLHAIITYFIAIPVSPSNDALVEFVREAWGFSLLFVNALFLLILVFIGLATILRLQSYQLQKTLPLLIVVALLVNFSGVLVGFVVDISNIITNFFLKASINAAWWTDPFSSLELAAENLGQNIARILYYMLGTLIYFIVMLLFGVRVIILWTLTILAPLAFAALVLPATRTLLWTKWWSNLIQWSIIGIPISFFLYLSGKAVGAQFPPSVGADAVVTSLAASFFAPLTALFLLLIGITLSMQLAPAGASAVIDKGKQWGVGIGKGLGGAVARRVPLGRFGENIRKRGQGIEVAEAEKTRLERWGGRVLGKIPGMGRIGSAINVPVLEKQRGAVQARIDELEAKKKKSHGKLGTKDAAELDQKKTDLQNVNAQISTASAGVVTRGVARFARRGATLLGGGLEMTGKELDMRIGAKDEREVAVGTKDVGNKDSFQVFNMVNEETAKGPLANWNRIVGMLNGVRNRGDGDDIEDALKSGQLNKKVIGGVIKNGQRVGPPGFRPLLKSLYGQIYSDARAYGFDADVDEHGNVIERSGKDAKFLTNQKRSLPSKFNAQDFQGDTIAPQNFDTNTKEGRLFLEMILKGRGADFMSQLGRRPRKEESRAIMEYIFKEGGHAKTGLGINWLLDNDAEDVLRYLDSPGARSLGLGSGITRREIEELVAKKQQGKTPSDLYAEGTRLDAERKEQEALSHDQSFSDGQRKGARDRTKELNKRIQQIETTLDLMDEDVTPTQRLLSDVVRLQNDITQATQTIEQDALNIEAYRKRATAERGSRPLQQELERRGVSIPTTPQEQNYGALLEQRTRLQAQRQNQERQLQEEITRIAPQESRRQQLLQEIENTQQEMQAPGLHPEYIANLGQKISLARQELTAIEGERRRLESQIHQTTQQFEQAEQNIGNMEVELRQVPKPPAPLPNTQPNMPNNIKKLIDQGNTEIQEIGEQTQILKGALSDLGGLQKNLDEVAQRITRQREELRELNVSAQAGTLTPEGQARHPAVREELSRLQREESDISKEINRVKEEAVRTRGGILRSKERVDGSDGIRAKVEKEGRPLQRKYESAKKDQQRKQELTQRQEKRKKKS